MRTLASSFNTLDNIDDIVCMYVLWTSSKNIAISLSRWELSKGGEDVSLEIIFICITNRPYFLHVRKYAPKQL